MTDLTHNEKLELLALVNRKKLETHTVVDQIKWDAIYDKLYHLLNMTE